MPITSWNESERPRERFMEEGPAALSEAELLAILIGSGTPERSAVGLMKEVLADLKGSLRQLGMMTPQELCRFRGIGTAKAVTILAAMELAKRREQEKVQRGEQIKSSADIFRYFSPRIGDLRVEEFHVLLLRQDHTVITSKRVCSGGLTSTLVDLRTLFSLVFAASAPVIAVCHNHPSGSVQPSPQDDALTRQIADAARLLEVRLLDHLVIAPQHYFSYRDEGKL